ncbi:MAG: hypothetical protein IJX98_01520 [Clostridia bacterium]|nr:hypothetical protein [Clostridia bacterium]
MKKIITIPLKILGWIVSILLALVLLVFVAEKLIFGSFFFTGAKVEMMIPGLWTNFVPQGFDQVDEDTYLMSGYDKSETEPSMIYVLDGDKEICCKLYNQDGTAYTSHAGGVTHFGDFVYVANDTHEENTYCDMFSLADILDGDGKATTSDRIEIPNRMAYCSVYDGKLYAGAFYREGSQYLTPDWHHLQTPAGDQNTALMLVYTLDETTGKPVSNAPEHAYSTLSNVQGMCFTASGKMVLSTSWGLNASNLYVYDVATAHTGTMDFNGTQLSVTYLDSDSLVQTVTAPPMSEELVYQNGRVYILTESASMKYIFGKIMSGNFVQSYPIA